MSDLVYILCAVTALACAVLLLRGYVKSGAKLLLWSGLCFVGLTVNNTLVAIDLNLEPDYDLLIWRNITALLSMCLLVYGLIWDAQS